ncbi:MAG TPA: hypothetical protein VGH33_08775 [Isosphaeraceae bacterium]
MNGDRPATVDDRRRHSIADGMIVVAAVAVGLVLVRETLPIDLWVSREWARLVTNGVILLADFLVPSTFALVAIQLRQPRPSIRRLVRRPGFLGCLAACVAMAAACAFLAVVEVFARVTGSRRVDIDLIYIFAVPGIGFSVLGAWTALAANGRSRRPAPGGIDRAGWLVGWGWLLLPGIIWVVIFAA